ncbi:caspase-3-like [Heteronotia binoei]|uniref:caspase-3-like n=1 Tax=Heteronotia binoei TaxID=13085 RepID=UPI00292E880A|nr:caspase-3-like [Heteronotia binoei]
MAKQNKNRALLIVNYDFYRSSNRLTARPGAVKEADRLYKALSNCNYAVQLRYDLTAEEIQELYEKECDADHGDYFVSILSSHGEEGIIFDCEGQPVELTQIFEMLSLPRSHKLAGKPKIFFIQACRGEEIDPGVWVQTDSSEPQADCFSHYLSIPEDTAVMFACSPGYAAFINRWESMFLKALLELLEGENRQLELTRLMTWINWRVAFNFEAKGKHSGGKEMPCFVTNMVKEVYPFSSQRRPSSKQ